MARAARLATAGLALSTGLVLLLALGATPAQAAPAAPGTAEANVDRVTVNDPYIELHTGPGRGYPVFHVAAKGETVDILLRHTDWFKVRLADGAQGWVSRQQMAATLAELGGGLRFADWLVDDLRQRRVEAGAGLGRFHGEPLIQVWTSARLSDTLSLDAVAGQVQGVFSGTDLWHVDLRAEPWVDQAWSPFFAVGLGRLRNVPNRSLVDNATTNANTAVLTAGLRWRFAERFTLRGDYAIHTGFLSDSRTTDYRATSLGLSFTF